MKKIWLYLGIGVVVLLLVLVSAGYFLVIKPKDLGVRYTQEDVNSVNKKLGIEYNTIEAYKTPSESIKISGTKNVSTKINQREITALLAEHSKNWEYSPLANTQVRINSDNTIEVSGKLNSGKLKGYAEATDLPEQYKKAIEENADKLPVSPSIYIKTELSVKDGKVSEDVKEVKIGPVSLDAQWFDDNQGFVSELLEDRMKQAGINADSLSFENGEMELDGTIPESISFG